MKTSSTTVVYFLLLLVIVELCEAGRLSRNATANTNNEQQMVPNDKYGCKYRPAGEWSVCSIGVSTRTRVMHLRPGQPDSCPTEISKARPCRLTVLHGNSARKAGRLRRIMNKKAMCKGRKSSWSECKGRTKSKSRRLRLRSNDKRSRTRDDKKCRNGKQGLSKKCKNRLKQPKDACKYIKGAWSTCDARTLRKMRILTLKSGSTDVCNSSLEIYKPCRHESSLSNSKYGVCRYKRGAWTVCDVASNTRSRLIELVSGEPSTCRPTVTIHHNCRQQCRFLDGQWSECNLQTKLKTRVDQLSKGGPSRCNLTRIITRWCDRNNSAGCRYVNGEWSACNSTTYQRSRIDQLVLGNCNKARHISRPCMKPNGEERCFFREWGDYGPCQNGVSIKHREVVGGGLRCERKAVKTQACS